MIANGAVVVAMVAVATIIIIITNYHHHHHRRRRHQHQPYCSHFTTVIMIFVALLMVNHRDYIRGHDLRACWWSRLC